MGAPTFFRRTYLRQTFFIRPLFRQIYFRPVHKMFENCRKIAPSKACPVENMSTLCTGLKSVHLKMSVYNVTVAKTSVLDLPIYFLLMDTQFGPQLFFPFLSFSLSFFFAFVSSFLENCNYAFSYS